MGIVQCGDAEPAAVGAAQCLEGCDGVLDGVPQPVRSALGDLPGAVLAGNELGLGEGVGGVGDDAAGGGPPATRRPGRCSQRNSARSGSSVSSEAGSVAVVP